MGILGMVLWSLRNIWRPTGLWAHRSLLVRLGQLIAAKPREALEMGEELDSSAWGPLSPRDSNELSYLWPVLELHAGRPRPAASPSLTAALQISSTRAGCTQSARQRGTLLHRDWLAAIGHVALIPMLIAASQSGRFGVSPPLYVPMPRPGTISLEMQSLLDGLMEHFDELQLCEDTSTQPEISFYHLGREQGARGFWEAFSWLESDFLASTASFAQTIRQQTASARTLIQERVSGADLRGVIGFHARTSGYHRKWNRRSPQLRDFRIETMSEAIDEAVAQGFAVVRFGDWSMSPLDPREGLVDLTDASTMRLFSSYGLQQWHCLSQCDFMIGGNSGWQQVAELLRVPLGVVNYVPVGIPPWIQSNIYSLASFRNEQRCALNLTEVFANGVAYAQNKKLLANLTLTPNTSSQIKGVLLDMISFIESSELPRLSEREIAFRQTCQKQGVVWRPRLAESFTNSSDWISS